METFKVKCVSYEVEVDYYPTKDNEKAVLIFLPGWPATKASYAKAVAHYQECTNLPAYVVEYSGLGASKIDVDTTCPAQHFLELIKVYDWVRQRHPGSKIVIIGTSYGGFLSAQLVKYRAPDILVLRVPGIFKPEDFYTLQPDIDRDWTRSVYRNDIAALKDHPLLHRVKHFNGKTLVVVHELDDQVPRPTTDAYIDAFGAEVYLAEGFEHGLGSVPGDKIKQYEEYISGWINRNLG